MSRIDKPPHAHGPTQAEICWVNGGSLSPAKCPRCAGWDPERDITSLLGKLDNLTGGRRG